MNACSWKPKTVTLHDGTQVASDSEAWRHECEARAIIAMPTKGDRRAYLRGKMDELGVLRGGVLQRRGEAATRKLEETINAIWYSADRQR